MKKTRLLTSLLLLIAISFNCFNVYAKSDEEIKVYVDGIMLKVDEPPIMLNNRVLVPFRAIFEALDFKVSWEAEARQINASRSREKEKISCNIQLNNNRMIVMVDDSSNGSTSFVNDISFEVPPQIINGRTLVPLRAVSEALGCEVNWNGSSKTVTIVAKDKKPVPIETDSKTVETPIATVPTTTPTPQKAVETPKADAVIYSDSNKPVVGDTPAKIIKDLNVQGADKYADAYRSGLIGECVWYAKGRFYEVYGVNLSRYDFGSMSEWIENAEHPFDIVTWKKVETPFVTGISDIKDVRPLSIVVYGPHPYSEDGHVAFVEYVEKDSSGNPLYVYITESNGGKTLNKSQFDPGYDGAVQKIDYNDFINKQGLLGYIVPIK